MVPGFLINRRNPNLSLSSPAFLPQFIRADEDHPVMRMLELSSAFMAMTFAVFVVYGLFAASVRDRIVTRPKLMNWLRRAFAGGVAALGGKLAFAERGLFNPSEPSFRGNRSRQSAPDDRLREAIQKAAREGWIASSLRSLAQTLRFCRRQ